MADACRALGTPVTGGNVSFYNETLTTAIFPTPVVGMVGLLDDIRQATTPWFKAPGDVVLLLGETREELGGSEYLKIIHDLETGRPPRLDLVRERAVQQACLEAIRAEVVRSAHDCSDGGLAVTLAESCMTGPDLWLGATLALPGEMRPDALLFGESASRIVVSARPEAVLRVRAIARQHAVPCAELGVVGGEHLKISGAGISLSLAVEAMRRTWATGLSRFLG
jgi:phosphoribosylformylglycinamidine synthase subunit PurL